ncbi:unnamed protein product [Taenia asiatica]|uniref:Beta-1,3-galactosyl-O-glycosyl-glycoprotein beta-1,6-N-acetylglucosaminyltransferase 3-like n=1 Tax=Taenia asiatica TaxID=60517 RepID=A0A0R3VZ27_TAEAS|nr:unnamed protein product [Taenia asiatica]
MRIHCRRVTILRLAIILLVTAFTFCIIWKINGEKGVDGEPQEDLEYFAAIDSPLHPRCKTFRQKSPIVDERDGDMDIAFTLVVHKDAVQIARLIRMIHRTNNYYCIHPDLRSSQLFVQALKGISTCFGPNVELVPLDQRVDVKWGDESVLKPQLICGKQALQRHTSWKYLINLVGQDFPLRTNLELIAALKALNGSNLIESLSIDKHKHWVGSATLPLGVSDPRGSIYGAYLREFLAEAILGSKVEAIRKVMLQHKAFGHPDELFFPTLAYNSHLQLPGSCLIAPTPSSEARFHHLGKYVIWVGHNITCSTKYVRGVCILGEEHVGQLKRAPHISANKFHAGFHPEAYNKMERWYFDKVQIERSTGSYSKHHFDPAVYAARSCSRYHV